MSGNGLAIFGEVLFDCFPGGEKVLGGAPFNVAWHLQAFGQSPCFISRIGADSAGDTILKGMQQWGMGCQTLQRDDQHPTGKVTITLEAGEPTYEIVADVAYDFIDATLVKEIHPTMLYHGSLGLRNQAARAALEQLKKNRPQRIFMDVNLRDPWWKSEDVLEWVSDADWVKLNEVELALLHGSSAGNLTAAIEFKRRHDLEGIVVTLGAKGALVLFRDEAPIQITPERNLNLVDTVGAGDALTSVILLGLILDWPIAMTLERAQLFASAIVGQRGAVVTESAFYQTFLDAWQSPCSS